jgi:hypothetical protein
MKTSQPASFHAMPFRDVIVHEIVANLGGSNRVTSAGKKKILETKNASRTPQSHLWCNIALRMGNLIARQLWRNIQHLCRSSRQKCVFLAGPKLTLGNRFETGGVAEFTWRMGGGFAFGKWTSWRAQNPKVEVLNWTGISTLGSSNLRLPLLDFELSNSSIF